MQSPRSGSSATQERSVRTVKPGERRVLVGHVVRVSQADRERTVHVSNGRTIWSIRTEQEVTEGQKVRARSVRVVQSSGISRWLWQLDEVERVEDRERSRERSR